MADDPMMSAPGIDPPTLDEQMAEIRFLLNDEAVIPESASIAFQRLIPALLAEVERLRAWEATAMEVARAVANLGIRPWANQDFIADFSEWCAWCGATDPNEHTADCPVTKARTLLAEESEASE